MLNSVSRSKIFSEFSEKDQKEWFSIKEKAVRHHIDSLYYSVYLQDDSTKNEDEGLMNLLSTLKNLKEQKTLARGETFDFFGLDLSLKGVISGVYVYCLELPEYFDFYFAQNIPNELTPRIHVQIRTQALMIEGLKESVLHSFNILTEILDQYGLTASDVVENRIDYAFHTNAIQNPEHMFADEQINKHLDTGFAEGNKHFALKRSKDEMIDLDYLALGNRKSNHLFFRIYNKGKEVIQMNYKSFFFKIWQENGLISAYDRYCYEYAYQLRSYRTGLLLGRIEWYLDYGSDQELKNKLSRLIETCNIRSDNNPRIEAAIKGILPPVTKIMNVEYETRRSWYKRQEHWLADIRYDHTGPYALKHLFKVLYCRPHYIKRLTSDVVCFTEDRRDPDAKPMDFWRRIQRCKIDNWYYLSISAPYSTYSRKFDKQRMKTRLLNTVASLSVMLQDSTVPRELGEDMWDIIGLVNDNDVHDGKVKDITNIRYRDMRRKKARQLRSLVSKHSEDEDNEETH